ncbi:MAG: response regulator transcription factor [Anaerolineae bacterium]|nr:response regulator transcription factor [Anaerolineae bacterium]
MTDFNPAAYRILAVDDDALILELIEESLLRSGFQVATVSSGEDGLDWMKREGMPDLAVVDINMPFGMDGLEFCTQVHNFSDLPIIMLTAVENESTIIQAIETCAEDYVTKPFTPGEVIARARRILRRIGPFPFPLEALTRVDGNLSIDFAGCQAIVAGTPVSLTPTETKLLYLLIRSTAKPLNTDYLLRRLWPHDTFHHERLRVYVHRLRSKLTVDPDQPKYISSVRGVGYVFDTEELSVNNFSEEE